jgi:hypothetical protein
MRATKADVIVRVRRAIVQVQGKRTSICTIVPIATTKETMSQFVVVLINKN